MPTARGDKTLRSKAAAKGELISKAIYGLLTSPKKRTDEFDLFEVKNEKANKTNLSVRFWEKLADHKLLSRLTDL